MSLDPRFDELANIVLDGVATPDQNAELQAWVARDPAARERWSTLQKTFEALSSLPRPEPPADLKPAVMRAIRAEAGTSAVPGARPSAWFRWVTTFAAGAAAGILVWSLAGPRIGRDLPTSGTMAPAGRTIDRASLDAGTALVEIETREREGQLEIHVRGGATSQAEIEIDHGAGLEPSSVDGLDKSTQITTDTGHSTIRFRTELGCAIWFKGTASDGNPIRVTLRSEGETAEGKVQIKK